MKKALPLLDTEYNPTQSGTQDLDRVFYTISNEQYFLEVESLIIQTLHVHKALKLYQHQESLHEIKDLALMLM